MCEAMSPFRKFLFPPLILDPIVSRHIKVGGHHIQLACRSDPDGYNTEIPPAECL